MKRSEISLVLLQEQHGRRLVHKSIELAWLRSLFFEYVIHAKINAALKSYYAEIFYEYIAHKFMSLTYIAFDMPFSEIIWYLKSIK